MSIKVMARVWEHSKQNNGKLLLLLALADYADDSGVCWPGVTALAKKARVHPRQAKRHLRELEKSGDLFVLPQRGMLGGRGYTNLYFIATALTQEEITRVLVQRFELDPDEAEAIANRLKDVENVTHKKGDIQGQKGDIQGQKGDIQGKKRVTSTPPEPSYNHHESVMNPGDGQKTPPPPSHDPAFLPDAEQQMGLLLGRKQPGIADPSQDQARYFQYQDQALQLYKELTGYYPDTTVGKPAILKLVSDPDFSLQKWRSSIETCRLAGVKASNVGCVIDTYQAGGDYKEMQRRKNGDRSNGRNRQKRQTNLPGDTLTDEQRAHAARLGRQPP